MPLWASLFNIFSLAQSAGAVEHANCISVVELFPQECLGYDTKQSDGKVPVMLELWGMWITPSSPSFPSSLWPRVVKPDKSYIYGSNRTKLRAYAKLNYFK